MFQEIDNLISSGDFDQASVLLEKMYNNLNNTQKVEAVKRFSVTAKDLPRIYKLSHRLDEAILISTAYGKWDEVIYFESEKLNCLAHKLSMMYYRQANLKLSSQVFPWLGFALESNKNEYEYLEEQVTKIDTRAKELAERIIKDLDRKNWSAQVIARVHLQLADYYSTLYLHYLQKFMRGGKVKSKLANSSLVRRWNLFLYLYSKYERQLILEARELSFKYAQLAVDVFVKDSDKSGTAHALYNYAIKLYTCNKLTRALKVLGDAEEALDKEKDFFLLNQIVEYRKLIKGQSHDKRDYVEELGLARPANYG